MNRLKRADGARVADVAAVETSSSSATGNWFGGKWWKMHKKTMENHKKTMLKPRKGWLDSVLLSCGWETLCINRVYMCMYIIFYTYIYIYYKYIYIYIYIYKYIYIYIYIYIIITLLRGEGGLNEIFHVWIPPHLYIYNQNHPLHRQEARIYGYRVMYTYIIWIYI